VIFIDNNPIDYQPMVGLVKLLFVQDFIKNFKDGFGNTIRSNCFFG
jgi:hypothetical protein